MAQLCLWTKIRTKQWFGFGALAFQCCVLGFCAPNVTNLFAYIPAKFKISFILKDDFFSKIWNSCKSICRNISQGCSSVYTTIFVRRKDKTNYPSNQTWANCYHSRKKHQLKKKTLDGGHYITDMCTNITEKKCENRTYCYESGNGFHQIINKSSKKKNNGLVYMINE